MRAFMIVAYRVCHVRVCVTGSTCVCEDVCNCARVSCRLDIRIVASIELDVHMHVEESALVIPRLCVHSGHDRFMRERLFQSLQTRIHAGNGCGTICEMTRHDLAYC